MRNIVHEVNIVPIPRKIEIGKPGRILLCFKPDIVMPVPIIMAIDVRIITNRLLV